MSRDLGATPIHFTWILSIACPLASIIYALGFPESLKIHPHHLTCLHLFSLIQCPFFSCLKLHFRILQVTYFVMNMQKAATNFLCQSPFSSKVDGSYQLWRWVSLHLSNFFFWSTESVMIFKFFHTCSSLMSLYFLTWDWWFWFSAHDLVSQSYFMVFDTRENPSFSKIYKKLTNHFFPFRL